MRKTIARGVGYAMAPKLTFAARHPRKAAIAAATGWTLDRLAPSRRRRSRRRTAMAGIGAAVMTIPLGMYLGRRLRDAREEQTQHYAG